MLMLHRLGFIDTGGSPDAVKLAYGPFIQSQVDELASVVDQTQEAVSKVTSNTGYNKKGITEKLREIGDTARDHVRKLSARRKVTLDNDLATARAAIPLTLASMRPQTKVIESLARGDVTLRQQVTDLTDQMRYTEIRTVLLGYTEKGMLEADMLAGATHDLDLLLAIETAPKFIRDKLVNPDAFEKARSMYLEVHRPEQFKRLSTVQAAVGLFEANDQQARKTIAQACGVPLLDVPTVEEVMAATE